MANETSKAHERRAKAPLFQEAFLGHGIDIGGGNDPLKPTKEFPNMLGVELFDVRHGDANFILKHKEPESFNFVYSSQTLEHMDNPFGAIYDWWKLVMPGGHMVITVPDETLYEQAWPHRWNSGHRTTWRLDSTVAPNSWGPGAITLRELCRSLPNSKLLLCELVDANYDYELAKREIVDQTMLSAEAFLEVIVKKVK